MRRTLIIELLAIEEGFSSKPYYCSEGYPTIGIGQKIGRKGDPLECYDFTVDMNTAQAMIAMNLERIYAYLDGKVSVMNESCKGLNYARYAILTSMAYQLGIKGLDNFKKMWKAIEQDDWELVALEALNSRWSKQTPSRADRHAEVLRTGDWAYYNCLMEN